MHLKKENKPTKMLGYALLSGWGSEHFIRPLHIYQGFYIVNL